MKRFVKESLEFHEIYYSMLKWLENRTRMHKTNTKRIFLAGGIGKIIYSK